MVRGVARERLPDRFDTRLWFDRRMCRQVWLENFVDGVFGVAVSHGTANNQHERVCSRDIFSNNSRLLLYVPLRVS